MLELAAIEGVYVVEAPVGVVRVMLEIAAIVGALAVEVPVGVVSVMLEIAAMVGALAADVPPGVVASASAMAGAGAPVALVPAVIAAKLTLTLEVPNAINTNSVATE